MSPQRRVLLLTDLVDRTQLAEALGDVATAALGAAVVTGALVAANVPGTRWIEALGATAIMAHPLFLLRLVAQFRDRPVGLERVAVACTVASAIALLVAPAPVPAPVALPLVAYFVVAEMIIGWMLVQGAVDASGFTRWRIGLAALGSALIAAIIGIAGVVIVVPSLEPGIQLPMQAMALASGLAYYAGFSPPDFIRRSWQLRVLMEFLDDSAHGSSPMSFGSIAAAIRRLVAAPRGLAARRASDGRIAVIDEQGAVYRTLAGAGPLEEMLEGRISSFQGDLADLGWVVAAPIEHGPARFGVAIAAYHSGSMFPDDDRAMLAPMGHVFAVQLARAERLRHDADLRLSAIVESSRDAIVSKDLDGVITSWNRGAEALYGYTADEAIGQNVELIVPPASRDELGRTLRHVGRGEAVELPHTLRVHKDGRHIEVALVVSPIWQEGRIVGGSAIARDIGWELQSRRELEASQALYRDLFDNAPIGYHHLDAGGRVDEVNLGALHILRRGRDEVVGHPWTDVLDPSEHARFADALRRLANGESMQVDQVVVRPDGTRAWVDVFMSAQLDEDGALAHIRAASIDVTALRLAEQDLLHTNRQLARSNEELQQFAYVASHDLRAPLRAISQLASWIAEDLPEGAAPEVREHVDLLLGRVARMERLLGALLRLARAGGDDDDQTFPLTELVAELRSCLSVPEGFDLSITSTDAEIQTSRTALLQVLQNLVDNALKHHRGDRGRVDVVIEASGTEVAIEVSDDGPGIEPRFHDRIFGAFQTLRPRDDVEGSGMGLAIVRKTVERRGGSITVESELGRGATFRVRWPVMSPVRRSASMAPAG